MPIYFQNLKNFYLDLKTNYTKDDKYLAVITQNGLWIKDSFDDYVYIINAQKIDSKFLVNTFITQFDSNYEVIKNIQSKKINIERNEWVAHDVKIYQNNESQEEKYISLYSNFNYEKVQSLFSNLSSLSIQYLYFLSLFLWDVGKKVRIYPHLGSRFTSLFLLKLFEYFKFIFIEISFFKSYIIA